MDNITPTTGNAKDLPNLEQDTRAKLELIYRISRKIGSGPRMAHLLEQIIEMTQKTFDAEAASILLLNEDGQELYFEAATGPVGKVLRQVKVNTQYSIAGQVIRTGEPFIVNDFSLNTNFRKNIDKISGFTTKSLICAPLVTYHKTIGVLEVLNKLDGSGFTDQDMHAVVSVATTAAMAIENTRLHQTILDAYKSTISTLAEAIDAKDPYTIGHSRRVMEYSLLIGASLLLSPDDMETLEYASTFHDIGKIVIDSQILNKPGALTPPEWNIIREHPAIGANLIKKIPFLDKASQLVLSHHERYDGKGYPGGLKGEDIPMGARIIAVADAFDTMTTNRAYRPALNRDYAISELQKYAGKQFCPVAVETFISSFQNQTGRPSTQISRAAQ